jgi:hypothetical protein
MDYYQNKYTYEVWKLSNVTTVPSKSKNITIYVFENGEHWSEEEFLKHWDKVEGYISTDEELDRN